MSFLYCVFFFLFNPWGLFVEKDCTIFINIFFPLLSLKEWCSGVINNKAEFIHVRYEWGQKTNPERDARVEFKYAMNDPERDARVNSLSIWPFYYESCTQKTHINWER